MEFAVRRGPWKPVFSGTTEGHRLELYANKESMLLSVIYDEEDGKVSGALIEVFSVFSTKEEAERLVEGLKHDAFLLEKHSGSETLKFVVLDSGPGYAAYEEDDFLREAHSLIDRIERASSLVKDVAKSFDVELKEIHLAPENEKAAFYSIPFTSTMLMPSPAKRIQPKKLEAAETAAGHGEIIFGVTKQGGIVSEPLSFHSKTLVSGGNEAERIHMLRIVAESALLSHAPTVIIDWRNSFEGMNLPAGSIKGLKEHGVNVEPIGFPVTNFSVPEEIKADLNIASLEAVTELFGFADKKILAVVSPALKAGNVPQALKQLEEIKDSEISGFQKDRIARILRLLDEIYPAFFNGKNDVAEIAKIWGKALGRAGIINFAKIDKRQALLVMHSLAKELLEHFKKQESQNALKCFVIAPEISSILGNEDSLIARETIDSLLEFEKAGIGFALSSQDKLDLVKRLADSCSSRISIVKGNDIGIQSESGKSYRISARPALSKEIGVKEFEEIKF